jgi:hypothetical protein
VGTGTTRPSAPSATGSRSCDALCIKTEASAGGYLTSGCVMADNGKADKERKDETAKEKRDKNGALPGVDKKRWDDFKKKG